MDIPDGYIVFTFLVCIVTYAYVIIKLWKRPEPMAGDGVSVNAWMAFGLSTAAAIFTFFVLAITGVVGYLIVLVVFPPIIHKLIKKYILEENKPATI